MSLDISAFRSIASQNLDKFVYAKGEELKVSRSGTRHGANTYKAAADAFVKACTDHYGVAMGDAIRRHLLTGENAGKPLTARKIRALVAFADEKAGSATSIAANGKTLNLDEIGTAALSGEGWGKNAKIASAQEGQRRSASAVFSSLKFGADGNVDIEAMLRNLNTFHAYVDREVAARNYCIVAPLAPLRDPGAPDAPAPAPLKETRSQADVERAKLLEKEFFTVVDAMDNNELSAVYQGLISRDTDGFKKELARIINHPEASPATKARAEKAFADLSRIEAMVVSEISRRMILDKTPDDQKANVPSLMERYAGAGAPTANHYAGQRDMSTVNLAIVAGLAAKGSNDAKTVNAKTDGMLKSHGMGEVDSKKIGDMLRSQELTVNMKFAALMGYRRSGEKAPSLFKRPNAHLVNTFESKEEQGLDLEGTGQLKHRNQVEKCFFPEYGEKPIEGKDRPVYGALNTSKMTSGAADTNGGIYGKVVVVMRQHVKQNCTYTLDDSFWATRISLPAGKRAEMEEKLVAAFASKLENPEATLAEIRRAGSEINMEIGRFYLKRGADAENIGAHALDNFVRILRQFLNTQLNEGADMLDDSDLYAHFVANHALGAANRNKVAGYDNIENLLSQEADFTALSMGVATLRQQENPNTPCAFSGCAYIEAQIHGPVMLDRDVEEIRIDKAEMEEHFSAMYAKLPQEQRAAVNRKTWVQARCKEAEDEIREDTRNAPFKVVFYDSDETFEEQASLLARTADSQNKEAVKLLKDDLVALGEAFRGERFGEIKDKVLRMIAASAKGQYARIQAVTGENLEHMPGWFREAVDMLFEKEIANFGADTETYSEAKVLNALSDIFNTLFAALDIALEEMDARGIVDPAVRESLLKEIARAGITDGQYCKLYISAHVEGMKALADVNAFVCDTLEKDVEGGKDYLRWAFAGNPPVAGAAQRIVVQRIQNEIRALKAAILDPHTKARNSDPSKFAETLRKKAVLPFIAPKARILAAQVHMAFPSEDERNAFIAWAASAGKIKTHAEFAGVYEGSTLLADSLAAKLATGAPLAAQDLVDCYKAFIATAFDYMLEDAKGRDEYGPDDRQSFISRIVSVALSRLAARVGREGLVKIAAALDTPDARWLHTALILEYPEKPVADDLIRQGTFETAAIFFETLHQRLSSKFDIPTHPTNPPPKLTYALVPPVIRAMAGQINPVQAQDLGGLYPYNPAASGARRLVNIPAPANPAALPQDNAGRKQFLLRMLPIYHNHEKTFDRGTNYHGRTHATRAFVFSIAMGNILKEKGVTVDLNAVALATAGHDTGRTKNGRDTAESEKRSAEKTIAAVNEAYPGAAGPAWTAQLQANITSASAAQETIEGYLFKSADSLDYSRIDKLDEAHFPFLKEPIFTPDGFVLSVDKGIRNQLMKEAKLLAQLTSPHLAFEDEYIGIMSELANINDGPEYQAKQARQQEIVREMNTREIEQTANLTDAQVVDLVENAIRERPQDFPLLSKYYLGAGQAA